MSNRINMRDKDSFIYKNSSTINYFRFFMAFCANKIDQPLTNFVESKEIMSIGSYSDYVRNSASRTRFNPEALDNLYHNLLLNKVPGLTINEQFISGFVKSLNELDALPSKWVNKTINTENFKMFLYELMKIGYQPIIIEKNEDQYIEQSLYTVDASLVCRFDQIDSVLSEKNRICIVGEGGLGKTTFLKHVENLKTLKSKYKKIIYIQLHDDLLNQMQQQNQKNNFFLTYVRKQYSGKVRALLLLDGFDELLSHTDAKSYAAIISDLEKLSSNSKLEIIATSRYMPQELTLLKFTQYTLNYVPDERIEILLTSYKNVAITEPIKELLRIPMFYSLFKNTDPKDVPHNRYELLLSSYIHLFKQRHEADPESHYHYLYFYLLPKILCTAYNQRMINGSAIGDSYELKKLIKEIRSNEATEDIEYTAITHEIGIRTFSSTEKQLDEKVILDLLTEDDLLMLKEGKYYVGNTIKHQYWHAFLVSLSLITSMKCLRENYSNDEYAKECVLNFNIQTEAITMICTHLFPAFFETIKENENKKRKKRDFKKQYKDFFDKLPFAPQFNESRCGYVKYAHMAFHLAESFQFDTVLSETKESLYYKTIERGFKAAFESNSAEQLIFRKELIELATKIIELTRKSKDYLLAAQYIDNSLSLLRQNIGIKLDQYEEASFLNQQAKILIIVHCQACTASPNNVSYINHNAFYQAFTILEKCAEYFTLSANLYGRMLTTPALYIKEADLLSLNPIAAFWNYYNCGIKRIGRYLDYTLRQAVSLLIRGIVKLKDDYVYKKGTYQIKKTDLELGNYDIYSINVSSLTLAIDICELTFNHSLGFWNYLIGSLNHILYLNSCCQQESYKNAAILYFDKAVIKGEEPAFSLIRKKQLLSLEYEEYVMAFLKKHPEKMQKAIDQPDKLHPIYLYVDIKNIVLNYEHHRQNTTEFKKYSALFHDYEEHNLSPLCRKIVNEQTTKYEEYE